MRRREFLGALGGAAVVGPRAVFAQQGERIRRIAVLAPLPATVWARFFEELRQLGFIEGDNLAVDRQGFDARYDQFPAIVAALLKDRPEAILCGGDASIRAMQAATTTIPIVALTDD